jgi:hypothetical protein
MCKTNERFADMFADVGLQLFGFAAVAGAAKGRRLIWN